MDNDSELKYDNKVIDGTEKITAKATHHPSQAPMQQSNSVHGCSINGQESTIMDVDENESAKVDGNSSDVSDLIMDVDLYYGIYILF